MMDYEDECAHDWTEILTCPECEVLLGQFCTHCGAETTPDYLAGEAADHKSNCPRKEKR
jgi:hypothetical protein